MPPKPGSVIRRRGAEKISPSLDKFVVPIDSLLPDPAQVRLHPPRSIEQIAASLARFGQQKAIVVDEAGVIVAGNGTFEAARKLGWTKLAVIRSSLEGVDRVGYAIADNRTAELSEWDKPALGAMLNQLPDGMAEVVGFTPGELEQLLDDGKPMAEEPTPAPLAEPVARPGEIWRLGPHRLMCGDSTNLDDVRRLMAGEQAKLCATDPPYLVDYTGKRPHDTGKDWSDSYREVDIVDAEAFFRGLFTAVLDVLAPHAAIYCWHAHKRIGLIQRVWEELGILDHQQIIWVKPTAVFGASMYHFQHEPCVMGWRRGSVPAFDGRHDRTTVWVMPWDPFTSVLQTEDADVWMIDWEGKSRPVKNEHPTQKPLEIFARPMRKHTQPGDLVYEPFSGSGSQLVAAHKMGRCCNAMELSPIFVDVSIRRWQAVAGEAARLDDGAAGETWDEARANRIG